MEKSEDYLAKEIKLVIFWCGELHLWESKGSKAQCDPLFDEQGRKVQQN